jgi:hypothetical protein
MPTYKNNGTDFAILESTRVYPGKTYETLSFIEALPTDVVKISDAPMFNPVLLDQSITTTTTISVPSGADNVNLVLYAEMGNWTAAFNSASNTPAMTIAQGISVTKKFLNRMLNSVILTGSGKLYVRIDKA